MGGVMPPVAIKDLVLQSITQIAPEANLDRLNPEVRFRDQFDFDSVDLVNLVEKLKESVQCKIPEIDYPQLTTLNGCISYLESVLKSASEGK